MGAFLNGLGVAAVGWWFAPVITFLLNKLLSYLYDASQDFMDMRSGTMPRLKLTLGEVVEQRMLIKLSKKESDVTKLSGLDSLLKKLKDALYEAEDILDLVDYHRIEKEVGKAGSSTWLQWCWEHLCDITREKSAWLLQRAKQSLCWLRGCLHVAGERSAPLLQWVHERFCWLWPWVRIAGQTPLQLAKKGLCLLWGCVTGPGELLPYASAPSTSLVQRISSCCTCIFHWLTTKATRAIEGARYYRDWSLHELGFTRYQQATVMESNCIIMGPLYILLKKNMKKVEKLIDEAQEIFTLKNKVQETIGQAANQQRRNELGMLTADVTTGDRQKTTAYPVGKITDRDNICQDIRTMLHASKCDVVGIYGIAGSGKTTLAQYVCNAMKEEEGEKEERKRHFHLFMWIHVTQKFSVHAIFSEMLEAASGKKAEYASLDVMQKKLEHELSTKRFLLVLDDVWCNKDADDQNLQQLIFPLKFGLEGSKILATSRNKGAFAALSPEVTCTSIRIPDLKDEDFHEMFMYYALGSSGLVDPMLGELEEIGAEIAKKLKRLPLAARTVGGQLRRKQDVWFWRSVQVRDLLNETTGALWWSYQQFDEHVRQCFAYCSIFSRRHHFKRDELVQFWMAEVFIETTNAVQDPYDVGQNYFDELLSASFLQLGERILEHGSEVDYFTVHDLLHDLAEEAARGDCFRIEEGVTEEVPPAVRHLSVGSCDIKMLTEKIFELQNLRTLIIDCYIKIDSTDEKVFERMFKRLKKLRVLVLSFSADDGYIFSLPACIGLLKHLRYFAFNVRGRARIIMPNSVTKLYHIQALDNYSSAGVVFTGSKNISQLINLRCIRSMEIFPDIGRLKWLQKLERFSISKTQGYELRQLKDLSKLEGVLIITGLENVQSKEESIEASLAHKDRLTQLTLSWGDTSCSLEVEAEVLEGLCPPKYLERLEVMDYHGSKYPDWMVGQQNGSPMHLRNLWLFGCSRLESAPELFEVFVHLRWFRLSFSNWHSLPDNMERLASLLLLEIHRCPNIQSLPALPSSLERFFLRSCSEELMSSCETIGHPNWQKIQRIPYISIIRD
ncbi:hypothetical protein CFC21_074082 [Triticum aestivum]|uniref:NB-ARC domain-containing protein n=2 Tax=Triticum aestivum TaxID=4565 RepID=A0A9R1HMX5_WHEAT|nr:putative disease resistance protein RGA3 [Triticum aestivum]KAF7068310.1 hypothetical protein CFC21_074082 [Triticum aestivum]